MSDTYITKLNSLMVWFVLPVWGLKLQAGASCSEACSAIDALTSLQAVREWQLLVPSRASRWPAPPDGMDIEHLRVLAYPKERRID